MRLRLHTMDGIHFDEHAPAPSLMLVHLAARTSSRLPLTLKTARVTTLIKAQRATSPSRPASSTGLWPTGSARQASISAASWSPVDAIAVLDGGMGFSLVPWKPVIEQRLGQQISATVQGSGASWEIGRQRGPSVGVTPSGACASGSSAISRLARSARALASFASYPDQILSHTEIVS